MKVYLDKDFFEGGGRSRGGMDPNIYAIKILEKALKESKKAIEEGKKKPDKKDEKKDEDKFGVMDYFIFLTSIGSLFVVAEAWIILSNITHLVEVLHK